MDINLVRVMEPRNSRNMFISSILLYPPPPKMFKSAKNGISFYIQQSVHHQEQIQYGLNIGFCHSFVSGFELLVMLFFSVML